MTSAAGAHARSTLSIGEVLGQLRPEFPDITISKIRFLEAEGLIHPERTPSGYRKFSSGDVARLRFVLAEQRDHYLPLRVIKDHLDAIDRGLEPPEAGPGTTTRRGPRAVSAVPDGLPGAEAFTPEPSEVRMTRDELLGHAGLEPAQLDQLEQYGLLSKRAGGQYDGDALVVATCAAEMARYGIEPRHLRAYRTAADREIGLFEQVVTPMMRQRNPEARGRAEEAVRELAALSVRLHSTLVKAGLRAELGG
ncbi:MAG TPA: MerR family transcriptional regulator [Mycobacteriales bacterium]|nr:MerR family transcriptional regulator [Mycobacteriales bacterium]